MACNTPNKKIVTKRKAFIDPSPTPVIPNKKPTKTSVFSVSQHPSVQAPHRYGHGELFAIKEAATGTSMSRNGSYKAGPLRSLYTWSHNLYQWPKINGHSTWDYNPTANILGILTPFKSSRGPPCMQLELIKAPSRISRITVAYFTSIISPQREQTQLTQLYKFDPNFHHTAKRVAEKKQV